MDIFLKLFPFSGEGELFMKHGGGRFETVGGEDFEDFREEFGDF